MMTFVLKRIKTTKVNMLINTIWGGRNIENKDTLLAYNALDIIRVANILERLGGKYAQEADLKSV